MLKDEKKLNHEYARQRITINAAAESQFNKKMLQYIYGITQKDLIIV